MGITPSPRPALPILGRVSDPGRSATLVLVHEGAVLGCLPPVDLAMPWWPESHDVVAAARERFGIEVTVLRLVRAPSDRLSGGHVAYLAEVDAVPPTALEPFEGDPLADEPLRQEWARPGGPAALLGWAHQRLEEHGIRAAGRPEQMRSWNLSAIWRLPTTHGRLWLKVVPSFFAHEGAVIDWIGPDSAPRLLAHARGRVLMAEIPGPSNHDTRGAALLLPMVEVLTAVQERSVGRTGELLDLGVPDRRLAVMVPRIRDVVGEHAPTASPDERRALDRLVEDLPRRLAEIDACGIPDALVHGDFHPGNVGGPVDDYVVLDWGDSFVGNPLIDELAFVRRLGTADRAAAREAFVEAWRRIAPSSDPGRAAELLQPVLPLLAAVMYADFCAAIEPDERVYHASDVGAMLRQAAGEATATQ
jgi:Phosphotransferase enzyme family